MCPSRSKTSVAIFSNGRAADNDFSHLSRPAGQAMSPRRDLASWVRDLHAAARFHVFLPLQHLLQRRRNGWCPPVRNAVRWLPDGDAAGWAAPSRPPPSKSAREKSLWSSGICTKVTSKTTLSGVSLGRGSRFIGSLSSGTVDQRAHPASRPKQNNIAIPAITGRHPHRIIHVRAWRRQSPIQNRFGGAERSGCPSRQGRFHEKNGVTLLLQAVLN